MVPVEVDVASSPRLADFLCFAVYSANLAYGRAYKRILEELGVTYTQYIAIVALWEQDHQTVSGLGEKLFLESNSVLTPALTLYESAGFVHAPRPGGPPHYARGNVYMVYRPDRPNGTDG